MKISLSQGCWADWVSLCTPPSWVPSTCLVSAQRLLLHLREGETVYSQLAQWTLLHEIFHCNSEIHKELWHQGKKNVFQIKQYLHLKSKFRGSSLLDAAAKWSQKQKWWYCCSWCWSLRKPKKLYLTLDRTSFILTRGWTLESGRWWSKYYFYQWWCCWR